MHSAQHLFFSTESGNLTEQRLRGMTTEQCAHYRENSPIKSEVGVDIGVLIIACIFIFYTCACQMLAERENG